MKFGEYWSKRVGNKNGNLYGRGRKTKKTTLVRERMISKRIISNELNDVSIKSDDYIYFNF